MTNREKRLEKAQLKVFWEVPFFAAGVSKLPVTFDDSIPTACTNGRQIRWSGKHFDSMSDQELVTVLCHETAHCLLGHLWRKDGRDHEQWNEACDYAVNDMLAGFGELVKAKNLANPFPMPAGALVGNPAFKDMAEEAIYAALNRPKSPQGAPGGNKAGQGGQSPAGGQAGNQRQPFGEFESPQDKAGNTSKQLESDWGGTMINSAKLAGELPASVRRLIEGILHPQLPWWEILRNFLREQCSDDWDWMKPNVLFDGSGFMLPTLESEKMGPVVFATDTSGSIDGELLAKFQAEKQGCLDDLSPAALVDIYCDARIQKVSEYRPGDRLGTEAPGGGGTSFVPVLRHIEDSGMTPKCLVYLTDLYGDFGDKIPPYPVLWIVWGDNTAEPPFGQRVKA